MDDVHEAGRPAGPTGGLTADQEELLALRVTKRSLTTLAALAAPFVAVAALFGVHSASEIRERREAFGLYVDSAKARIEVEVKNAHGLRDTLRLLTDSLRLLAGVSVQQSHTQAEVFKVAAAAYQAQANAQISQSAEMLNGMKDQKKLSDSALVAVRDTLRKLDSTRKNVDARLASMPSLERDVQQVRHLLDSLESRMLNSGTIVVKERNPLVIHGMGLWLRYESLSDHDEIVGLTIRDTETDEFPVQGRRLPIGQSLPFKSSRAQFRITPRYRVNGRMFGRDMVGLHIEQFALASAGPAPVAARSGPATSNGRAP